MTTARVFQTVLFSAVAAFTLTHGVARAENVKSSKKQDSVKSQELAAAKAESGGSSIKSASPRSVGKPGDVEPKITFSKFYDRDYIGDMQVYTARYEDTMVQIARDFKMGFVELRSANPFLDPWIPGEGKKVLIPSMHLLPRAPREGVVVNLADMRMYVFLKPGQAPTTYALGIGREGLLTPNGTTSIIAKKKDPVWRPTARMRKENPMLPAEVPPGPDNPLGEYALYLGWPEYRIHSTDKPYSIGRRASSGCIRMYPDQAEEIFKALPNGTQVTVVNQSIKSGWIGDKMYIEAHLTMEQADKMEVDGGLSDYVFPEEDLGAIVASAGEYAGQLDWALIRQVVRERRGYPVEVFRKAGDKPDVVAEKSAPVPEALSTPAAATEKVTAQDKKSAPVVTTPN